MDLELEVDSHSSSRGLAEPVSGADEPHCDIFGDRRRQLIEMLGPDICRQLGVFATPPGFCLSVIVPVYNEFNTIRKILARIRAVPLPKEIVIVDDASTDGTRDFLKHLEHSDDLKVIYHDHNQGKGAAVKTGLGHISGQVVVIQDADLEYDPSEYPRLVQPILEGKADAVFGSRFLGDGPHRVLYFWHYLGNRFLTTLSNCFTNLNLTDMETCYKVLRRDLADRVSPKLVQRRFGIEPEITARIARERARVYEVAISYSGRTYEEGKKIGWRDGVKALWCIFRYGLFN